MELILMEYLWDLLLIDAIETALHNIKMEEQQYIL